MRIFVNTGKRFSLFVNIVIKVIINKLWLNGSYVTHCSRQPQTIIVSFIYCLKNFKSPILFTVLQSFRKNHLVFVWIVIMVLALMISTVCFIFVCIYAIFSDACAVYWPKTNSLCVLICRLLNDWSLDYCIRINIYLWSAQEFFFRYANFCCCCCFPSSWVRCEHNA